MLVAGSNKVSNLACQGSSAPTLAFLLAVPTEEEEVDENSSSSSSASKDSAKAEKSASLLADVDENSREDTGENERNDDGDDAEEPSRLGRKLIRDLRIADGR
mmetsp:Transcript_16730/g.29189  ORF Transcript_16730/g.29189 Transcript_16730/m.29189 type:complete len:103 (+) Transcript_16730:1230-1538(+)